MGDYQDIVQKIIDKLKNVAGLVEGTDINKYYFGAPARILAYPTIYVQFVRREPNGIADTAKFGYILTFEINLIDIELDKAANLSLDNLVEDTRLSRSLEVVHAIEGSGKKGGDYAITYARMFHRILRYE
ncbi:MAG: hypothetical protein HYU02_00985 [Thaumarchaeota archaeon]|nr:hypothetical protein [Nitrososphaerota archaeon]